MRLAGNRTGRIPSLDGIRGLAISMVLWWHTFGPLIGTLPNHRYLAKFIALGRFSWSGVDLFFVLSGFLIGGILLDEATSASYFPTFYLRRAYRILPLYAVVLGISLAVNIREGTGHLADFWYYIFFFQNVLMAADGTWGIPHLGMTWSLAVEEQFYLTLPAVVRFVPKHILWRVLLAAAVSAPLIRVMIAELRPGNCALALYFLTPCRADALCLGVLLAITVRCESVWAKIVQRRNAFYIAFACAGSGGIFILLGSFETHPPQLFGLEYSFLAIFYSLLLLSTLVSCQLSSLFSFGPLRFMGSIAYGIYLLRPLTGFLFQKALLSVRPESGPVATLLVSVLAAVAAIGIAALSWRYFEKPLVELGHRHRYASEQGTLLVATTT
jgi:peptidoglycan/LPS O-acetylase OafA/YrhL